MQGLLKVIVHRRVVEAQQYTLTLLRFQHRQALHRQFRCLLQRLDHGLQHLVHLPTDTRRAYVGRGHGNQAEALPQIVDVQAQRVVGALLAFEHVDALPRLPLFGAGFCAMAVVEHGAEQRQRCSHSAAALGQRQGRVFVR